ncbi:MAG TPA: hypothetical protein VFS21_05895 [Roseiflexaceae bacterium]|nr:hypothetical protein [Roseiflexaceae bacterium]
MSTARDHRAAVLLVLLFTALALVYSALTPLGEGPDEPGHAAYVFFLAREGRLPVQRPAPQPSDVPGEGHQPPLAYALAAPLLLWLPREERAIDQPGNPRFTWGGGTELNAVAHGSREHWPWSGAVLGWRLARLVSVALGALTVLATYATALRLCRLRGWDEADGRRAALLAGALVALNPQFLFTSALVTNDALLTALSALLLLTATAEPRTQEPSGEARGLEFEAGQFRTQHSKLKIQNSQVLLGGMLGLALLTKQSALVLVPVALLGLFPQEKRGWAALRSWAGRGLAALAVAGLVCAWWYLRNQQLYGDLFGLAAFRAEFTTQPFDPRSLRAWLEALAQLHGSFWAHFGWMNLRPPAWVIWCYGALGLLGAVGWLRRAGRSGRPSDQPGLARWLGDPLAPALLLVLLSLAWVVSFALTAGLVAWQGRLLFPALPAIAALLGMGLASWGRRPTANTASGSRFSVLGSRFLVLGLSALAAWQPFGVIRPAYPFHTLPEAVALARLGQPTYGRFGLPGDPGAELRGWQAAKAQPGEALTVTLMWHARGRQNRDWSVFLHLIDSQENILAEDNGPPASGVFPMTQWVAGDWIEDPRRLVLPPDLAPGVYTLRAGLWDQNGTGERAAQYNQRGRLAGDLLILGTVEVIGSRK